MSACSRENLRARYTGISLEALTLPARKRRAMKEKRREWEDETLATNATPSLPLVRSAITLEITLLAQYNGKFDSRRANTATPAELPDSVCSKFA